MKYMDLLANTVVANNCVNKLRTSDDDIDGTGISMLGYQYCTFIADVGAELDTLASDLYLEFFVEESADDSTYTAVADADISVSVTSTVGPGTTTGCFATFNAVGEAPGQATTTYLGNALYCRCRILVSGTHTNGTPSSVISIKHGAKNLPAA